MTGIVDSTTLRAQYIVQQVLLLSKALVFVHTLDAQNIVGIASTSSLAVMSLLQTGDSLIRPATLKCSGYIQSTLLRPASYFPGTLFSRQLLNSIHDFAPVLQKHLHSQLLSFYVFKSSNLLPRRLFLNCESSC